MLHSKFCRGDCEWDYQGWDAIDSLGKYSCRVQYLWYAKQMISAGLDPDRFFLR